MEVTRKWIGGIKIRLSDEVLVTSVLVARECKGEVEKFHPILWKEADETLHFAEHADHLLLGRRVKEMFEAANG